MVVGDVLVEGEEAMVGFWSGQVYALPLDEAQPPRQVVVHAEGIQAMARFADRLYVVDFGGNLAVYRDGRRVNAAVLERAVWAIRPSKNCLLAVGDRHAYRIQTPLECAAREPIGLAAVAGVHCQADRAVVVDDKGW